MIKSLSIVLFVTLYGIVIAQSNDLFVNFQPRADSGCQGAVSGVGYASSINTCIELPENSYFFIVDALRAGWKIYDDSSNCHGNWTDDSYKNGTCVEGLQFIQEIPATPYATMYISEAPITQVENSAIFAMYSDASCGLNALVAYSYITNGTQFSSDDDTTTVTIACDGTQPVSIECQPGCSGGDCCKTLSFSDNCAKSDKYFIKTTCFSL